MGPIKSEKAIQLHENSTNQHLQKLSTSSVSLTNYENTSLKCLLPQIIAGLVTATVFIAAGASMAYTSILISHLSQNNSEIKATDSEKSLIASITMVAIPPATLLSGILMDNFGRLNVIKLSCIPTSLGWLIIYWAESVYALVISSFLIGLSFSLGMNPCLVYITEISNPNIRMSLLSIIEPYGSLGMIVMYFGGWILDWKNLIWIGLFFALMPSIMCFWIHESPSWLILKGKTTEAKKSLKWIHQNQDYIEEREESFAELSLKLLQHQNKTKRDNAETGNGFKTSFAKLLEPMAYRPIIILSALYIFPIFSGMTITGPYAITFMKGCGTDIDAYFLSMLIEFSKFVISIISIYTLKIFKRRTLLTITGLGMAVSMCVGGFYTKWIKEGSTNQTWMPAVSLLIYNIFSVLGFTTLPMKFTSEFLPIEIRGVGYSILDSIFCGLMFTAIETYYYLNDILGGEAQLQWFFAAMCLGGVLFCSIFIPETKDRKLTEINDYFQNSWTYKGQIEQSVRINNCTEI